MIGEMRDTKTAKTAIEASLTGYLVLSTLIMDSIQKVIHGFTYLKEILQICRYEKRDEKPSCWPLMD